MTDPTGETTDVRSTAAADDTFAKSAARSIDVEVAWLRQARQVRSVALGLMWQTADAEAERAEKLADYLEESHRLFALTQRLVHANSKA